MRASRALTICALVVLSAVLWTGCSQDRGVLDPHPDSIGAVVPVPGDYAIPAGYYDMVDDTDGSTLRTSLHEIIDDNTKIPYTSTATDTWNVLEAADEDPNDSGRILDLYMNESYPKYGEGNTDYNREHCWPKSYGFPNDGASNYPYTDCHHLFLANDSYNSSRSNKPYRTGDASWDEKPTVFNDGVGGGSGVYPGNSNWTTGAFTTGGWEVWGDRRGDVARALFYMDVRYEGGTHGISGYAEPDLVLTDDEGLIEASNTGSNESVAYMGMLTVLLAWNAADPVDDKERARNDAVYGYQGNRNPFIDHPEWVDCIFAGSCDGGGGDPGGGEPGVAWINEFHYDNDSTDQGEFVEIAGTAGTDLSGWSVVGYNGNGGAVYKTVALSGTLPDEGLGFGALSFAFSSMQNGSPDGLALVDGTGGVVEFLSYEGTLTAVDGPAVGMLSVDIGVYEPTTTPIGLSLQLTGTGSAAADFTWSGPTAESPGALNANQVFEGTPPPDTTPPAAPTGLAAVAGDAVVDLDWDDNGESDLAGYNLLRSTSSGSGYVQLNGGLLSTSAFSDATVSNGTTYYYVVEAVDDSGNASAYSAEASATPEAPPVLATPWINEFHYDNDGTDRKEFVEIAGPAGTDLSGWTIQGYNGGDGAVYQTESLSGSIPDQSNGYGTVYVYFTGLQNGSPDGIALVDGQGGVLEFLSYEGSFTATSGPAAGLVSTDCGVSEPSTSNRRDSLQRTGTGLVAEDFTWTGPTTASKGAVNAGQVFAAPGTSAPELAQREGRRLRR